jgi:hydroxylamine reductase
MRRLARTAVPSLFSKNPIARNNSLATFVRPTVTAVNTSKITFAKQQYSTAAAATNTAAPADKKMFCFQCEQTDKGSGCTTLGVCGKTPETAAMQDLLVHQMKQLAAHIYLAKKAGVPAGALREEDSFILRGLYSTLTNVNFDNQRFIEYLKDCQDYTQHVKKLYQSYTSKPLDISFPLQLDLNADVLTRNVDALVEKGHKVGVEGRMKLFGTDAGSLQELVTYGLKGLAAYAREAELLGQTDNKVFDFMNMAMAFLSGVPGITPYRIDNADDVLAVALKCGETNITVMSLLDAGGNENFGHPEPSQVRVTPVPGKCILVSGHDLGDLNAILEQTEGKGINVYTHGELLPAHGYPKLKKFKHLVGNYGSAWQLQKLEFSKFPGAIVMTTNCIIEPRKQYIDRIFTTHEVGFPGVKHIKNRDFTEVINSALAQEGFTKEEPAKYTMTGFGHHAVLSMADIIINAVKKGDIKRFFLIGGCDGTEGERSYYKDLATALPKDNVILTLGCAKYRFNKLDHGSIQTINPRTNQPMEIPRLLDMGQCNDAYSAVKVASALANAFGTNDLNALPLSYAISWLEQKAVVIFLTLMHLGLRNVRIGPRLPAFIPPSTLNMLVEKFHVQPISDNDVQKDLKNMLQGN